MGGEGGGLGDTPFSCSVGLPPALPPSGIAPPTHKEVIGFGSLSGFRRGRGCLGTLERPPWRVCAPTSPCPEASAPHVGTVEGAGGRSTDSGVWVRPGSRHAPGTPSAGSCWRDRRGGLPAVRGAGPLWGAAESTPTPPASCPTGPSARAWCVGTSEGSPAPCLPGPGCAWGSGRGGGQPRGRRTLGRPRGMGLAGRGRVMQSGPAVGVQMLLGPAWSTAGLVPGLVGASSWGITPDAQSHKAKVPGAGAPDSLCDGVSSALHQASGSPSGKWDYSSVGLWMVGSGLRDAVPRSPEPSAPGV